MVKKMMLKKKYPDGGKDVKTGGDTKGHGGKGPSSDYDKPSAYKTEYKREAMDYKPGSNLRGEAAKAKEKEYESKSKKYMNLNTEQRAKADAAGKSKVSAETKASLSGQSVKSDKGNQYSESIKSKKDMASKQMEKSYDRSSAMKQISSSEGIDEEDKKAKGSKGIMMLKKYGKKS